MRYILAVTGASGIIYGVRVCEELSRLGHEAHVIITDGARITAKYEMSDAVDRIKKCSSEIYGENDLDAPMASGSAKFSGMIVAPCSMKTLASVANGLEDNLVSRAALVQLKERRTLVLLIRETPLSTVHIINMLRASLAGAIVMPASPAFYGNPRTLDDLINFQVGKVLDILGIEHSLYKRWSGAEGSGD